MKVVKVKSIMGKAVKFTDIGHLMIRLQKLSQQLEIYAREVQVLNYLITSLGVQNKTVLRSFLVSDEKDNIKIQEYQIREQILKSAKNLIEKLIGRIH